ncbi:MAG: adenylate/guanylate cyclase domain-containing protein [Deltaproteobacteria bacterium]|nr:MAG: adenylate/guanylate cyclase domain-containing protein [Deltaproteobacteria bacterium]
MAELQESISARLAGAVEEILRSAAQRAERMVARVRLAGWLAVSLVNGIDYLLKGKLAVPLLLTSLSMATLSLGILLILRRWQVGPTVGMVIPLLDALSMSLFLNLYEPLWEAMAIPMGSRTLAIGICAALLTVTGALRLRLRSLVSASVGGLALILASEPVVFEHPGTFVLALVLVGSVTLMTWQLMQLVRRAVRAEVERSTFTRFLPEAVVRNASDPVALVKQPRKVEATVLVTDLRGFTDWAESRDPTDVLAYLTEVQGGLASAVREAGGLVDKFLGDGMLAVFGAPEPREDHRDRALEAALRIRDFLEAFRRAHAEAPRLGMAIHSGPLVVGCVGDSLRLEFTILGDTVNTASRLEGLTKSLSLDLLVSEQALQGVDRARVEALSLRPLGPVQVRGRTEAVAVYGSRALSSLA